MKRVLLYGLLFVALGMQAQDVLPWPTDTIDGKVYYKYTVEKSIGLYRISKNFGVSQEAILAANPELKTRGLRYEEVILIPTTLPATPRVAEQKAAEPKVVEQPVAEPKVREPKVVEPKVRVHTSVNREKPARPAITDMSELFRPAKPLIPDTPAVADSLQTQQQTDSLTLAEVGDTVPEHVMTDTVRLAIMLPLQANVAQRTPTMDRFYDFYAGALLALKHREAERVDSLGQKHVTYYDVHTYDVGKYGIAVTQLTDSGALANMDAILGPAYIKPVEALAGYAHEHKIPVVIPFLNELPDLKVNPYLLKFNPSEEVQAHALMEHLNGMRDTINIVLVDAYTNKSEYPQVIRGLRDSVKARQFSTTRTTIRQILSDSISLALKDSVENILLFHTDRYSNVQLLMPYLQSGRHGKSLTVLSQYAWQNEHILLPQIYTAVFSAPDSVRAARYEQDFAQYFGHKLSSEQPRYDLLGYDLASYMLEALSSGTFSVKETAYEGLQSTIQFNKIENGGYENTYIVIQRR